MAQKKQLSTKTLIVVPVYNGEGFITRTLDSCLNQTLQAPVWVVDNLSTDKTREIVRQYHKKHSHIQLNENKTNLGRVGNWNRCLDLFMDSSFRYIHFVFAGDEILPECNAATEAVLEKQSEVGALAFPYNFVHKNGGISVSRHKDMGNKLFSAKEITTLNLGHKGFLGAILCNVYTKTAIQDTRFSPHFTSKHDFDIRILSRSKAYYLDTVLANFHLDCHQTFNKALSTWGFLEFTYVEAIMLEELKGMFSQSEYEKLKERIVLNGIQRQLQFYECSFSFKIFKVVIEYRIQHFLSKWRYFFIYYWKKILY